MNVSRLRPGVYFWINRMKKYTLIIAALLASCIGEDQSAIESNDAALGDVADAVYINGTIYTVNEAQPWAEAVAIKDGAFLVVGSASDVEAVTGRSTSITDLGGAFAMPGIVDAHTHGIDSTHPSLFLLTLDGTDQETLLASLKKYADENPDKEWIVGGTWPIGMFPNENPHREMLDAVVPDRPVFLRDQSGHSVWLNSKAIEIAGLDDSNIELDPRAIVERYEDGRASGTIRNLPWVTFAGSCRANQFQNGRSPLGRCSRRITASGSRPRAWPVRSWML